MVVLDDHARENERGQSFSLRQLTDLHSSNFLRIVIRRRNSLGATTAQTKEAQIRALREEGADET
jgi:hypothetical protein